MNKEAKILALQNRIARLKERGETINAGLIRKAERELRKAQSAE